jgi:ribonuclease-3
VTTRLLALLDQLEPSVVRQVFTHSSWVAERSRSYERLEFLGDSVLSLSVTTELYRRYPQFSEGHLARLRAYVVSRETCAKVAQDLGLGKLLRRHAAENHENGELEQLATNANVLADLTEALIGAIYLTFGLDTVRPAVIEVFTEHIRFAEKSYVDYKTELQELLARSARIVSYRLVVESGPAHDRRFEVEAVVDGDTLGRGAGQSKKRAEQQAAAEALAALQAVTDRAARPRMRLFGRRKRPEDES